MLRRSLAKDWRGVNGMVDAAQRRGRLECEEPVERASGIVEVQEGTSAASKHLALSTCAGPAEGSAVSRFRDRKKRHWPERYHRLTHICLS